MREKERKSCPKRRAVPVLPVIIELLQVWGAPVRCTRVRKVRGKKVSREATHSEREMLHSPEASTPTCPPATQKHRTDTRKKPQ